MTPQLSLPLSDFNNKKNFLELLLSVFTKVSCGYEGATFRILGRIEDEEGIGCSSVIT